jgi:hypothetical protein
MFTLAVAELGMLEAPEEKNAAEHSLACRHLEIAAIIRIEPGQILVNCRFELGVPEIPAPHTLYSYIIALHHVNKIYIFGEWEMVISIDVGIKGAPGF